MGFVGGTGSEGRGLALRLALAGEEVLIGSRDPERARRVAKELTLHLPEGVIHGGPNQEVAEDADVVFLTIPFNSQRLLLESLSDSLNGKIVISLAVPADFSQRPIRAIMPENGSAALEAQALLPNSRVVSSLHTVSAVDLLVPHRSIDCDVVVCSNDSEAKTEVMRLVELISSLRAVDGGSLDNAHCIEGMTVLLMNINNLYRGSRTMLKIVGFKEGS